jgi:hypothetical protein
MNELNVKEILSELPWECVMMIYEMSGTDLVTNYTLLKSILYNKRRNTPTNYGLMSDSGTIDAIIRTNKYYTLMMSGDFMEKMDMAKTKPNTTIHVTKTLCELMRGAFSYCMQKSETFNKGASKNHSNSKCLETQYFKIRPYDGPLPALETGTIADISLSKENKDSMLIRKCKYIIAMAAAEIVRLCGINSISLREGTKKPRKSKKEETDPQESDGTPYSLLLTRRKRKKRCTIGYDDELYVKHRLNKTDQLCRYLSAIYAGERRTFVDQKVAELLDKETNGSSDCSSKTDGKHKFFHRPRNVCYSCLCDKPYDVPESWRVLRPDLTAKVCYGCVLSNYKIVEVPCADTHCLDPTCVDPKGKVVPIRFNTFLEHMGLHNYKPTEMWNKRETMPGVIEPLIRYPNNHYMLFIVEHIKYLKEVCTDHSLYKTYLRIVAYEGEDEMGVITNDEIQRHIAWREESPDDFSDEYQTSTTSEESYDESDIDDNYEIDEVCHHDGTLSVLDKSDGGYAGLSSEQIIMVPSQFDRVIHGAPFLHPGKIPRLRSRTFDPQETQHKKSKPVRIIILDSDDSDEDITENGKRTNEYCSIDRGSPSLKRKATDRTSSSKRSKE